MRSWFAWALPILMSPGLAFGSLLGLSLFGNMPQQDAVSDLAGAGGALLVLIAGTMGFSLSFITVVTAKIRRQKTWDHFILRIVLCIAGGVIVGALGMKDGTMPITITWLFLFITPIICSWPWLMNRSSLRNKVRGLTS